MIFLLKFVRNSIRREHFRRIHFRVNELARFSDGTAIGQSNDTSVLVTAVCKSRPISPNLPSFVPLTVDYREKSAAAGRIPTNYLRRDLGLTDHEVLTGRMIDRSIRTLFPSGFFYDTQITCNILSVDGITEPDVLAINTASASLATSDIPWNGPIGAVRIGSIDEKLIVNPTRQEMKKSDLNLVISVNEKGELVMIDGSANRFSEEKMFEALKVAVDEGLSVIEKIKSIGGKSKRSNVEFQKVEQNFLEEIKSFCSEKLLKILSDSSLDKIGRDTSIVKVREEVFSKFQEKFSSVNVNLSEVFNLALKEIFRQSIFDSSIRCDGRKFDEIRPIRCQIDLHSPLHGSALFQRGQTQVLSTVAFDALDSQFRSNEFNLRSIVRRKPFILHYEFPPYATNEIGRTYGRADRRELGHGALAEKGVEPIVPENLPFLIRLTSEVLESNGSSSMATVCAASLALMDAGIEIREPVAGVAIGLVSKTDSDGNVIDHRILTDILGIEDYMGDTDFKVAGTRTGITAIQADVKNLRGLSLNIVEEAFKRARDARCRIIDIMDKTISSARTNKKKNTPVLENLTIPSHKRGRFLGIAGMNLKKILSQTGVTISPIDENSFSMFAPNGDALREAKEMIEKLLEETKEIELEFGAVYTGKIVEIRSNGVLVQLHPSLTPSLLPNSQLDRRKVDHPTALGLNVGDQIQVKYFGRDPVTGTMRISRKILLVPTASSVKNFMSNEKKIGIWDVQSLKSKDSQEK